MSLAEAMIGSVLTVFQAQHTEKSKKIPFLFTSIALGVTLASATYYSQRIHI